MVTIYRGEIKKNKWAFCPTSKGYRFSQIVKIKDVREDKDYIFNPIELRSDTELNIMSLMRVTSHDDYFVFYSDRIIDRDIEFITFARETGVV